MRTRNGWLTVAQVAEEMGVSVSTVYRDIREGRLRAVVPRCSSRGMVVSEAELGRFWDEEFVPTAPPRPETGPTR